jgi:hypothetical protein
MSDRQTPPTYEWLHRARANGWDSAISLFLDVAQPFAPLLAQLLWVGQPLAGVFGQHKMIETLATALDDPAELAKLRQLLDDDDA